MRSAQQCLLLCNATNVPIPIAERLWITVIITATMASFINVRGAQAFGRLGRLSIFRSEGFCFCRSAGQACLRNDVTGDSSAVGLRVRWEFNFFVYIVFRHTESGRVKKKIVMFSQSAPTEAALPLCYNEAVLSLRHKVWSYNNQARFSRTFFFFDILRFVCDQQAKKLNQNVLIRR